MTIDTADTGPPVMDCAQAIERLHDYLAGELDAARAAAIVHHLEVCTPCVRAFDFEAELRVVISSRAAEVVPDELRLRIWHRIAELGG